VQAHLFSPPLPAAAVCPDSSKPPHSSACTADWKLDWEVNSTATSCGRCESLYQVDPSSGQRAGEPLADCFGTVAYADGCAMALSDGVSWGAKPRLAARRAVYAALKGMNDIWSQLAGKTADSNDVLQRMLQVGPWPLAWQLAWPGSWPGLAWSAARQAHVGPPRGRPAAASGRAQPGRALEAPRGCCCTS
jgi:hypothetical protein